MYSPKISKVRKYGDHGGYSVKTFDKYKLPASIVRTLVTAANHSLAKTTWSSYKTAERHVFRIEKETGIKLRMPFGTHEALMYIGWLKNSRNVSVSTIDKYLSGIRLMHLKEGYNVPALRPDIVQSVLVGLEQQENVEKRLKGKVERLAVTKSVLKLIKHELKKKNWSLAKKRIIWAICLLAFHGSFRIHELLSREMSSFDPSATLLLKDINIEECDVNNEPIKMLKIWLKSPKEQKKGREL